MGKGTSAIQIAFMRIGVCIAPGLLTHWSQSSILVPRLVLMTELPKASPGLIVLIAGNVIYAYFKTEFHYP